MKNAVPKVKLYLVECFQATWNVPLGQALWNTETQKKPRRFECTGRSQRGRPAALKGQIYTRPSHTENGPQRLAFPSSGAYLGIPTPIACIWNYHRH
jgi:hypothetical protein